MWNHSASICRRPTGAIRYLLEFLADEPDDLRGLLRPRLDRDRAVGHQLGAASAAFFAGAMRTAQGSYLQAFIIAGLTGIVAAGLSLMIGKRRSEPALAVP